MLQNISTVRSFPRKIECCISWLACQVVSTSRHDQSLLSKATYGITSVTANWIWLDYCNFISSMVKSTFAAQVALESTLYRVPNRADIRARGQVFM